MELTRRDTLAALSAVGVGSLAGCSAPVRESSAGGEAQPRLTEARIRTLVAVADAVYPSRVEGVESFVRAYSLARVEDDDAYLAGMADAVDRLEAYVSQFYEAAYADLPRTERQSVLDQLGVENAEPVPDGSDRQRVRYYLVNELLYAFYTTPTGAGLAGLENPPGHPGGTRSYRQGPHGGEGS